MKNTIRVRHNGGKTPHSTQAKTLERPKQGTSHKAENPELGELVKTLKFNDPELLEILRTTTFEDTLAFVSKLRKSADQTERFLALSNPDLMTNCPVLCSLN